MGVEAGRDKHPHLRRNEGKGDKGGGEEGHLDIGEEGFVQGREDQPPVAAHLMQNVGQGLDQERIDSRGETIADNEQDDDGDAAVDQAPAEFDQMFHERHVAAAHPIFALVFLPVRHAQPARLSVSPGSSVADSWSLVPYRVRLPLHPVGGVVEAALNIEHVLVQGRENLAGRVRVVGDSVSQYPNAPPVPLVFLNRPIRIRAPPHRRYLENRAMPRALRIIPAKTFRARGKSLGPMTTIANNPTINISCQPISNMAVHSSKGPELLRGRSRIRVVYRMEDGADRAPLSEMASPLDGGVPLRRFGRGGDIGIFRVQHLRRLHPIDGDFRFPVFFPHTFLKRSQAPAKIAHQAGDLAATAKNDQHHGQNHQPMPNAKCSHCV